MKIISLIFSISLFVNIIHAQETKTITGRIISEGFEPIPKATIYNLDTTIIATSNVDGYFKINVPKETNKLLIGFIAMEWTTIRIENNCSNLEIILMMDVIYDYISIKKINKKRYKRFKKLSKIHTQAFKQGIFESKTPCISYIFRKY